MSGICAGRASVNRDLSGWSCTVHSAAAAREERKERRPSFQFIDSSFAGLLRDVGLRNLSDIKANGPLAYKANDLIAMQAKGLYDNGHPTHISQKTRDMGHPSVLSPQQICRGKDTRSILDRIRRGKNGGATLDESVLGNNRGCPISRAFCEMWVGCPLSYRPLGSTSSRAR